MKFDVYLAVGEHKTKLCTNITELQARIIINAFALNPIQASETEVK